MNPRRLRGLIIYGLMTVVTLALLTTTIWALRSLILPSIVGAFLAYLFRPLFSSFKGNLLTKWIRISLVVGGLVAVIFMSFRMIKASLPDEQEQLELMVRIQYKLNERYQASMGINEAAHKGNFLYSLLGNELDPLMAKINETLELSPEQRLKFVRYYRGVGSQQPTSEKYYGYFVKNLERSDAVTPSQEEIKQSSPLAPASTSSDSSASSGMLAKVFGAVSTWLVMPLIFIFLIFDRGQVGRYFIQLIPNRYFELSLTVLNQVDRAIGRYIRGTLTECSLVGLSLFVGLYLIGIELKIAGLIGIIAGLANAIPFLGPVIGLVVGMAYALIVENINPILPFVTTDNLIFGVLGAVAVAQILDNTVFQPIVLGNAVNLHPLVVIFGVMGGSIIFGFTGMLLAIPTIVVCKVVTETTFKELKAYRII